MFPFITKPLKIILAVFTKQATAEHRGHISLALYKVQHHLLIMSGSGTKTMVCAMAMLLEPVQQRISKYILHKMVAQLGLVYLNRISMVAWQH